MLTGGCYCGRVRYHMPGEPLNAWVCHCGDCRRVSGAPFVGWFSVALPELRFVADAPRSFASSARARRSYCPDCGTPLTYQRNDLPDEIDITTCSLDDPGLVPPRDHVRTNSKVTWVSVPAGMKQFPGVREAGGDFTG